MRAADVAVIRQMIEPGRVGCFPTGGVTSISRTIAGALRFVPDGPTLVRHEKIVPTSLAPVPRNRFCHARRLRLLWADDVTIAEGRERGSPTTSRATIQHEPHTEMAECDIRARSCVVSGHRRSTPALAMLGPVQRRVSPKCPAAHDNPTSQRTLRTIPGGSVGAPLAKREIGTAS